MKVIFSCFFLLISTLGNATVLSEMQKELNAIAKNARQAVVSVQVVREEMVRAIEPEFFFGYMVPSEKIYKYQIGGIGSGFIVDERGYVVTNYHVVEDATKIKVEMIDNNENQKTYIASVVGGDKNLDIAILKIKSSERFPYLKLNTDKQEVGNFVIAIGYPFGFKQTFTTGVISSNKVSLKIEGRIYNSLIQTDAAINQGNSGGPLLNINGEVIGMNTAIYSPSGAFAGLGFAIPSWEIKRVVDQVIYGKKVQRAWLGVYLLPTDEVIRSKFLVNVPEGGIINKVVPNSPADYAGLRRGDIILSIDGEEVKSDEDVVYKLYLKNPGDKVKLVYSRNGKEKEAEIKLGVMPSAEDLNKMEKATSHYSKNISSQYSWKGIDFVFVGDGAYVDKIDIESPLAGYLQKGDLIKAIDNIKIDSYKTLKQALNKADISKGILFDLERDGEGMYISVTIRE